MNRIAWSLLVAIWPVSLAAQQRPASLPKTLRAAAVQMRSTPDLAANLKKIRELLEKCSADGVQVAVFPECAVTGYFADAIKETTEQQLASSEKSIAGMCRELKIAAVLGTPWREAGKLYNSALVIDDTGRVVERYHKVQLAENWPDGGDHLSVFQLCGVPCSIIICHDERYPELVRLPVLAGARVIFYTSHESSVFLESKVDPYRAQIQARAVENGVFIVHANAPANRDTTGSHGQSRLILPDGNIVKEAGIFSEEIVTADLDLKLATARTAQNSVKRGPLTKWYEEGVKQVRVIQ